MKQRFSLTRMFPLAVMHTCAHPPLLSLSDTLSYISNISRNNIKKFSYFSGSNHVDIFLRSKLKKKQ